ncbi:MAG: Unknown protein [uncultured Sulfurovum sp.]|uniref:Secreted protein n=1 Tax=uncultured Sulfurovum sp. TaxID=269237 RepID=A0A6S6T0Y8_9BACT|nr:MAG: Unknown protein [uncultured Sulfurovum sp.]
MKKIVTTLAILALTVSFAQDGKPPRGGKGQPPPEAIEACVNEEVGTECTVETRRGDTLEGTCQNTPDKKYFACVPNNHKKPERKE